MIDYNLMTEKASLHGIILNNDQLNMLDKYAEMLVDWNTRINLTGITDSNGIMTRHFEDSIAMLHYVNIPQNSTVIDVGTGAGFPGMVLALACPEIRVTLLDAQQKRLSFLKAVAEAAGAANVTLVHARAEDGARKDELREKFDIAAARAVAPLNVLCEYLLPYVKMEGCALCWKGPALKEETEAGRKGAHLLGGRLEMPFKSTVYGRDWDHMILPIRKVQHTSGQYPRKAGTPKNKPLGL